MNTIGIIGAMPSELKDICSMLGSRKLFPSGFDFSYKLHRQQENCKRLPVLLSQRRCLPGSYRQLLR